MLVLFAVPVLGSRFIIFGLNSFDSLLFFTCLCRQKNGNRWEHLIMTPGHFA